MSKHKSEDMIKIREVFSRVFAAESLDSVKSKTVGNRILYLDTHTCKDLSPILEHIAANGFEVVVDVHFSDSALKQITALGLTPVEIGSRTQKAILSEQHGDRLPILRIDLTQQESEVLPAGITEHIRIDQRLRSRAMYGEGDLTKSNYRGVLAS